MAAQETLLNGRYRLIEQRGAGGMAVVYRAQDLALGRTVAVKILRPSLTGDPQFLTRFRQEARNVANLQHPNIVTLYDVGQDGNTYYMVMEFVEGQDLKKVIRAGAPFSVERTLHIGIQICAGLGYAHRAGLVHADVKPQNILIMANDTVKITDFGIAQALSLTQPQERQSVVWGSPHYFSPEQASGDPPTPASDVYAIGIVLFEMLTGQLPYNGTDQTELALAHIREQVPNVRDINPNIPEHIAWVVNKVMSKEPAARYRTADQLGRILMSYQSQKGGNGGVSAIQPPQQGPVQSGAFAPLGTIPPQGSSGQAPVTGNTPPPAPPAQAPAGGTGSSGGSPFSAFGKPAQQPGYTPPPQVNPLPPFQPGTGGMNPVRTGMTPNEPMRPANSSGPYVPPSPFGQASPQSYGQQSSQPMAPVGSPSYQYGGATTGFDFVTLVLGFMAFMAVAGLIVLWLFVWSAYAR